jgi:hypothetical protein
MWKKEQNYLNKWTEEQKEKGEVFKSRKYLYLLNTNIMFGLLNSDYDLTPKQNYEFQQ